MSFSVEEGEIAVLLVPNGAGKSTIIKCIAGLLQYHDEIMIGDIMNKEIEAKKNLVYAGRGRRLITASYSIIRRV